MKGILWHDNSGGLGGGAYRIEDASPCLERMFEDVGTAYILLHKEVEENFGNGYRHDFQNQRERDDEPRHEADRAAAGADASVAARCIAMHW